MTDTRLYACDKCPINTYSNGGGFSIDGFFGEWASSVKNYNKLLSEKYMSTKCYTFVCKSIISQ